MHTSEGLASFRIQGADAVLAATRDAIVTTDAAGVITAWNPGAERLYGYLAHEAVGTSIMDHVVAGDLSTVLRTLAEGRHVPPFDVEVRRRDGETLLVHASIFGLYDDAGAVVGIGTVAHDVTADRRVELEAARQRLCDEVTGLPNRRRIEQEIAAAVAEGSSVGAVCVDLDRFRLVNDTWGHTTGDHVLAEVGRRLAALVPSHDAAARLGADQFVLIRRDADPDDLQRLAEAAVAALDPPVHVPGRPPITTRPSIGIAMARIDVAADDLLRDADSAVHRAKRVGSGNIVWFSDELRADAARRLLLQGDLRAALDEGAITVVYQPITDLATGAVSGVEALARWSHPVLGPISPVQFIAIAEESDLIGRLGAQVLERACRDVAPEHEAFRLSVNLSTMQLVQPGLAALVADVCAAAGLQPRRLTLEVVESALADNDVALATIAELRALGCRISIDDFGTGWSSLSRLKHFPIDEVKIDRTFVAGLPDDAADLALVEAVVHVATAFALDIVAEGVETQDQLDAVRAVGCHHAQGFLLGMPSGECAA